MEADGFEQGRRGVERLEAFSDGVFAIAITLLVLGIEVPDVSDSDLGTALSDLVPSVYAYFLGFAIIGLFWVGHHSFFAQVERHDARLLWTNLLFLSLIAAVPFSSGLIGEYDGSQAATIVFAANVALASFADHLSEWSAARSGLLDPRSPWSRQRLFTWSQLIPLIFVLSIPLTLISVSLAQYFWLLNLLAARDRPG